MVDKNFRFNGYEMRLVEVADTDAYYKYALVESDEESKHYTGTVGNFTKDQIVSYVKSIVANNNRYDFIILDDDEIIGEVVISEIEEGNCHYRICIFKKENFSKGIGFEATKKVFSFAFDELHLETVELEVFPFNKRGISLYEKMGFEYIETIKDDEADEPYKDICIMRLRKEK